MRASVESVRRLAVAKQHLAGMPPRKPSKSDIESLVRDLCYVQWDPVPVVAPSHLLSIWARLGRFKPSDLDSLMWVDRKVFEHWTPIASLVLTEDYPLYLTLMRGYPESLSKSWRNHIAPARRFIDGHRPLRRRILDELAKGPKRVNEFKDHDRSAKSPDGWSTASDVTNLLFHMHMQGDVMVVGHEDNQNIWGLTKGFLPAWTKTKPLDQETFEREAAQRAVRALGTAEPYEITYYFVRGRYQNLKGALATLQEENVLHRVQVDEFGSKDERYVHDDDLDLLASLEKDDREPRLSLIPPFDNMLAGNKRLKTVFNFEYVREQFLPKEKRRFGTYVLPIVYGERLIGRIDPKLDKERETLVINSVHAEPDAPEGKEVATKLADTIDDLAEFVGAEGVEYAGPVPALWKGPQK